ncbi:hypothetical protein O0L34_g19381 [Tuta absoluta]|nr:hypothetical protein O0L34_g19381 [Tuta absoluta]
MYDGKVGDVEDDTGEPRSKLQKLVLKLLRPYLFKGQVYMNNFYNSIPLAEKLLHFKTHSIGTLRVNKKGNPEVLVKNKLKKGEYPWVRRNKVYVSLWRDKRQVLMITTEDQPGVVETTNKWGQKRMKPKEVVRYNKHMSGIDRADQMISYYSTARKFIRWYKKVLFHMLDVAVWNALYLFRKYVKGNP